MEQYRVTLNAADAPYAINLDMQAESLASLVVKVMTICSQLRQVTGTEYELEELIRVW